MYKISLFLKNEKLKLVVEENLTLFIKTSFFKLKLKRYIKKSNHESKLVFKQNIKYPKYKKIISLLEQYCSKNDIDFFVDPKIPEYIQEKEYYINERATFGLSLKQKDQKILNAYNIYKNTVDNLMSRKLRDKQMWDSFFMTSMKCSCNFSVPGSGKTATVLGSFAYLNNKSLVDKIIMVGPKNSFSSWINEFQLCFQEKKELKYFDIQEYNTINKKRKAILYETGLKNLLLFNYESLASILNEVKLIIDNKTLLVFDEVHRVKSLNGVRAENAIDIAKKANYKIAMTGTPIPNSYLDIRNMLEILYSNDYDDFFSFSQKELKNPTLKEIENINSKIQPFFCRTNKMQLDVPPANHDIFINVQSSSPLNKIYNILKSKYRQNKLILIIRLMQVQSNPKLLLKAINYNVEDFSDILDISRSIEDIDYKDYSEDIVNLINSIDTTQKFNACIEVIEKLNSENKSSIVWCIFIDSILRIERKLKSLGISVAVIYGSIDHEERTKIINDFKAGKIKVLITNPHTLAESISLHSICHDAIYFEYSYNLVHLLQSKDRIHRLGLNKEQYTQYYFIQNYFSGYDGTQFSLDNKIYERLQVKEKIMIDAIEKDILEICTTSDEDIELLLESIKFTS